MKTLILTTATVIGFAAAAPAMAQSVYIGAGGGDRDRDCQMVEKRVVKNNKTVITKERRCEDDRRVYRDGGDRYVERRDGEAGVYIDR